MDVRGIMFWSIYEASIWLEKPVFTGFFVDKMLKTEQKRYWPMYIITFTYA